MAPGGCPAGHIRPLAWVGQPRVTGAGGSPRRRRLGGGGRDRAALCGPRSDRVHEPRTWRVELLRHLLRPAAGRNRGVANLTWLREAAMRNRNGSRWPAIAKRSSPHAFARCLMRSGPPLLRRCNSLSTPASCKRRPRPCAGMRMTSTKRCSAPTTIEADPSPPTCGSAFCVAPPTPLDAVGQLGTLAFRLSRRLLTAAAAIGRPVGHQPALPAPCCPHP